MKYIFEVSDAGAVGLRVLHDDGRLAHDFPRVLRMAEACRQLRRSRRHLYRYVSRGWLRPVAKFSGEFFFDPEDLRSVESRQSGRRSSLPAGMSPLFPEYELRALQPDRDADLILSRVLERGAVKEIRWALRHYSLARRRLFLKSQGRRLLSGRTFHFWSWLWGGVGLADGPRWRRPGLAWGGVS